MQADLTSWTQERIAHLKAHVRNLYWHIRNSRRGLEDAYRRRYYRRIARCKSELLALGVSSREWLDYIACCRRKTCLGCAHCGGRRWQAWV
jgi:hypothetical protein